MALTISNLEYVSLNNKRLRTGKITFDSSYPTGGEALLPNAIGLDVIDSITFSGGVNATPAAVILDYDYTNQKVRAFWSGTSGGTAGAGIAGTVDDNDNAATVGHALYVVRNGGLSVNPLVTEGGTGTGTINDSDTASTDGVAIYVVIDDEEYLPSYALGHFEFVSPTNAHGTCTVFNGGPTLLIEDDDAAATNGVVVRAIAADGGLEATLAGSGRSVLIPLSDGQYIAVADSTTGAAPQVYFDEDAANTYDRLQATVVDNLDETYELFESATTFRPGTFNSTRIATLVTDGPGATTSQGTVGSGGPEFDVLHDGAAANMVGAAPLYVQAAGAGFNAALPGGKGVNIPLSNGGYIPVAYAASPAGVQVYWDHDAASAHLRMLAVVADNADETYNTVSPGLNEVPNTADLSAFTARFIAVGY